MKNNLKRKLTIMVEAVKHQQLSKDIMKSIHELEEKLHKAKGLKLSFTIQDENNNALKTGQLKDVHFNDLTKSKKINFVSPENWDYWPV